MYGLYSTLPGLVFGGSAGLASRWSTTVGLTSFSVVPAAVILKDMPCDFEVTVKPGSLTLVSPLRSGPTTEKPALLPGVPLKLAPAGFTVWVAAVPPQFSPAAADGAVALTLVPAASW